MSQIPRFQFNRGNGFPDAALAAWERDGLLLIEDFAPPEECDNLRRTAEKLVEAFDPREVATVFSTNSHEH